MPDKKVKGYTKKSKREYWVEDLITGEKKKFTGRGRKNEAYTYIDSLRKKYKQTADSLSQVKEQDKLISQYSTKLEQIKKFDRSINRAKSEDEKIRIEYTKKLAEERLQDIEKALGRPPTTPQVDSAPSDPGIIQRVLNFFGSSSDDTELSESRWKAKKRSEIIGLLADGEIQIPEEYAGRNYDFRVDLVNAAWKAKMEKPAISKKVSEMTSQELKDFLDSYAK